MRVPPDLFQVSMIALGGPKLKLSKVHYTGKLYIVSMIALGGPKLKLHTADFIRDWSKFQ